MAILAQTTVKHPVEGSNIPVYAVNGYDLPVERRPTVRPCFARPPSQPFQTIRPGHAQRSNKRRKTNRESKLDPAQLQEQQHHEQQVAPWLASCLRAVQELKPAWVDPERDGVELLDKSAEGEQEVNMVNWQRPSSSKQSPVHLLSSSTEDGMFPISPLRMRPADVVQRLMVNDAARSLDLTIEEPEARHTSSTFRIPPRSRFCLSHLEQWPALLSDLENVNLVLMDPPWPNKSTTHERSGEYTAIDIYDLFKIDLPSILLRSPSALVVVWVTNKPKFRRFVVDKLFRDWGISVVAQHWYWTKLDVAGRPVFDLDSQHRRCYEGLIIGQWGDKPATTPPVPEHAALFTPLLGHSRKPYIMDVLRPYLPQGSLNVVELFARAVLQPPSGRDKRQKGEDTTDTQSSSAISDAAFWVSAGLECLKFNQIGSWLEYKGETDTDRPT